MVVDDEPLAMQLVCDYVSQTPGFELVRYTTNPVDALQIVREEKIDLIFLDVQMPELNGLNFIKLLNNQCKVILITAYQDYALDGFEHDVIDYLLKPVALSRFLMAAGKAKERLQNVAKEGAPNYLFVKTEYKIQKINLNDIFYLEGLRDYVAIHTSSGKVLSLQPMRLFEEKLPTGSFIRIHKSYIVAISKINFIQKNRVLVHNQYLPIGQSYKDDLLKKISAL